jgi:hypothetical protein
MMGSLPVAQAQSGAPELFSDAGAAATAVEPAHVMRSRLVHVNVGLLEGALNASVRPEITLNLFGDARFTGVVHTVEQNFSGGKTWTGRLKEDNGLFFLVANEGAFVAHVASRKGTYEVSLAGENLYKVVQIDQSKLGEDGPTLPDHPDPVLLDENSAPTTDPASPIDIMVIYTDDARVGAGGPAGMRAQIDLAMAETKTTYINGGVTVRLRLVHVEEVNYPESGDALVDLDRLVDPSDGSLDNIHRLRNIYGADMVALIIEDSSNICGQPADILATAATAFHVTARGGCMTGYYTFAHEFAHLQGARHDLYVDPNTTPYAYGHGYVDTVHRWRTVMAYVNECLNTGPRTYCDRLPIFSNPSKTYQGHPAGVAGSSANFRVLNTTALTVANFRQTKIGQPFVTEFNGSAGPWRPVAGTWTLSGDASLNVYMSSGIPNKLSSVQVNRFYGDLNFQARVKRLGCQSCGNGLVIRGNSTNPDPFDNSWRPSYAFSYSNYGTFSVFEIFPNGNVHALKYWTGSPAVEKNGWNTLKVIAVNGSLKFFINDFLVYSGIDSPFFRIGRVGVEFYRDQSSTGNSFKIDWARLSNTPTGGVGYSEVLQAGNVLKGGTPWISPPP